MEYWAKNTAKVMQSAQEKVRIGRLSNDKYERYCQEYVVDLNKVDSICRTGCFKDRETRKALDPDNSKHRTQASQIAAKLHMKIEVEGRIRELDNERLAVVGLSAVRVLERFREIAYDHPIPAGTVGVKDIIASLNNIGRHLGIYEKDNHQLTDPLSKLTEEILTTRDGLPNAAKFTLNRN